MIDIDKLSDDELYELRQQINNRYSRRAYDENVREILDHRTYIGKCFYDEEEDKYIRVLSSLSSNAYRFECLVFKSQIKCETTYTADARTRPSHRCFSNIVTDFFVIEDYPLLCYDYGNLNNPGKVIDRLEEISQETYCEKMDEHFSAMKDAINSGMFDTTKELSGSGKL